MLLHHHQQGFGKAAVFLLIFLCYRGSHLFEEASYLRVFHAHDMHRAGRAAGRHQRGKEHFFFHAEMPRHVIVKGLESGFSLAPIAFKGGLLGNGEFIVTGFMVGGHMFRNGMHVSILVNG